MPQLNLSQQKTQHLAQSLYRGGCEAEEKRVIRQLLEALLFEQICEFTYRAGYFRFFLSNSYYRVAGKVSGFSRIRIDADRMFFIDEKKPQDNPQPKTLQQEKTRQEKVHQNITWRPLTLHKLITDLPTSHSVRQQLTVELEQTIKLCHWNNQHLTRLESRRQLTYNQLESAIDEGHPYHCLLYTSPSPRDRTRSRMPSSA